VLKDLAALGVSLAVDDYGTGYSSLSYLRDLPVTTIKLDRSFVAGLPGSSADEAIVESTLVLARSLGLEVVAEGVEDDLMLRAVTRLGCQQAQGYFIGRPAPADALTAWLLGRRDAPSPVAA
jgi:EAL domain-containing protein (putative c-di-GMP-specific phosphodiesterase class I)